MSSDNIGGSAVGSALFRANPQAQQFVSMLSALYRANAPLYDPDAALLRDPNAWDKVNSDERFRAFIQQRVAKVARLDWVMEPATDREVDVYAAATVESLIRETRALTASRRHFAKFAFWGRSHGWIEGQRRWRVTGRSATHPEGLLAQWWGPTFIRPLDKRQVIYHPETVRESDGTVKTVRVKTLLGTIDSGKHVAMENPECLVTCLYDDEVERLGYGRGLLETMYHAYWIKGIIRRLGLSALEKFAHGILAARLDSSMRNTQDIDAQTLARTTLETLKASRSDGVIVLDKNDEVSVLKSEGSGGELILKWMDYIDQGVSQLVLSMVRPMGSGTGGAYGQAGEESDQSEDLLDCDRDLLDEEMTRSVVRLTFELNAAPLAELGLAAARCPVFRSRGIRDEDPEKVARVLQVAQGLGMQIQADEAHRRLRVKRPAAGDLVLTKPQPEPAFGPGFGPDSEGDVGGEGGFGTGRPKNIPRSDKQGLAARLLAAARALRGDR